MQDRRGRWKSPGRGAVAMAVVLAAIPVAILVLALSAAEQRGTGAEIPTRTVTISVQDGKFDGTNAPLELKVGERVVLTVVNREPDVAHDVAIVGLNVRTGYLHAGQSETLVFSPAKPGVYRYSCTLHAGQMDGQVIVRGQ